MTGTPATRGTAKRVLYPAAVGAVGGGLVALAEFVALSASADKAITPADLLPYAIFYALIWGVIGLALGIVLTLIAIVRRRPFGADTETPFAASVMLAALVLVSVGAYVNVKLLPGMFSRPSLLFDLALLVGTFLLARVIFRAISRRLMSPSKIPRWRSPLSLSGIGFAVVLFVGAMLPADQVAYTPTSGDGTPRDMNVLLLVVDALRADHLGCYGYERETSPTVDRMVREGVLFTRAYAPAPVTKHSTATLVTSLFPSSHGVSGISDALPGDTPTLMEEMKRLGYRTAVLSANAFVSPLFGFGRGTDFAFSGCMPMSQKSMQGRAARTVMGRVPGGRWIKAAFDAIDGRLPHSGQSLSPYEEQAGNLNAMLLSWIDAAPGEPFFAYVHYMEPHMPLVPPSPFDTVFDPERAGRPHPDFPVYKQGILPFSPGPALPDAELRSLIALYDGTIAYFDYELGRLLDALDERGLGRNTLIVITADHGEEFHDHGGWGHGQSLFEELIHVPLIAWYPDHLPSGIRVEDPVRHVDIMPTLLGAAGGGDDPRCADLEGRNLWPVLAEGAGLGPEVEVFAECSLGEETIRALRVGDEKLIDALSGGRERVMLFDLAEDPLERNDLSAERPDERNALTARAIDIQTRALSKRRESEQKTIDEGTKETLRALGYIH
jgi:arylsulfatase A-like enzyme